MSQGGVTKPAEVRLGKIPIFKLPPQRPVSNAETAHIKELIRQLAQIDKSEFGLPLSVASEKFAPVTGSGSYDRTTLTHPDQRRATPPIELVCIGPRALPSLLKSLEDTTPTQLTIKHAGRVMGIEFSNQMWGNLANAREQKILSEMPRREFSSTFDNNRPTSHTVTVGDICFGIIGNIVGRIYLPVHSFTGGLEIINSPTYDPSIVKAVRAIWSSDNPAQHLLDSLLLDYSTRGIFRGGKNEGFDEWDVGSTPQIPAVMRLLYYFPQQMVPIVARRLKALRVQNTRSIGKPEVSDADMDRWEKRELANEVRTKDFIKAITWCKEPEIRVALLGIFQRSDDAEVLLATVPVLDVAQHWRLIENRFRLVLSRQPYSEDGWYGDGYNTLVALRKLGGSRAKPLYRQYLKGASSQRFCSVCEALSDTKGEWDREFLWPMLANKRISHYYSHPVSDEANARNLPIRVCDQAAEVIAKHRKDVAFTMEGTTQELDQQIKQMQLQLAREAR